MLAFINTTLERMLDDKLPDLAEEATFILEGIEERCLARTCGELIFCDSEDHDALMESGGA